MWSLFRNWLLTNALRLAMWGAAAFSVGSILFSARRAGRDAERSTQLIRTLEIKDAQLRATINSPRTRTELVDQLRGGQF